MIERSDELLDMVFKISPSLEYETDADGIVTILLKQDHKIQRAVRKLGFRLPEYKKIRMDAFGSCVFLQFDANKNVREIGDSLEQIYGDKVQPLYERLLLFISHLEQQFHYIENINETQQR